MRSFKQTMTLGNSQNDIFIESFLEEAFDRFTNSIIICAGVTKQWITTILMLCDECKSEGEAQTQSISACVTVPRAQRILVLHRLWIRSDVGETQCWITDRDDQTQWAAASVHQLLRFYAPPLEHKPVIVGSKFQWLKAGRFSVIQKTAVSSTVFHRRMSRCWLSSPALLCQKSLYCDV